MSVRGTVLQQLPEEEQIETDINGFVHLPVVYVDDKLTTLSNVKPLPSRKKALELAKAAALKIEKLLQEKRLRCRD